MGGPDVAKPQHSCHLRVTDTQAEAPVLQCPLTPEHFLAEAFSAVQKVQLSKNGCTQLTFKETVCSARCQPTLSLLLVIVTTVVPNSLPK